MSQYSQSVLAIPNLFGYWRLGDPTLGMAKDETGNANGAYLESPILQVPGSIPGDPDYAVDFNRTGYMRTTLNQWPTQWSIGVIAKIHSYLNVTTDFLITTQGSKFGIRETTGGSLVLTVGPTTTVAVPGKIFAPTPETWTHIVATFDNAGGTATVYVNGDAVKQSNGGTFTAPSSLIIGIGTAGSEWNGVADEFFTVSRIMSQAEVISLYNVWATKTALAMTV